MIKKLFISFAVAIVVTLLLTMPVFAANQVTDIGVEVLLSGDGSADITQIWDCDFAEGTEAYFPLENLGEMTLSDFAVSDANGAYKRLDDWKVSASFNEKAGKCGIVKTARGYELCWGITDYGKNRYTIKYKLNGLVSAYDDYDGFNFQFINSGMGTLPTNVTVKIVAKDGTPINDQNGKIWTFGFDGQINFENGAIIAYTEKPLTSSTDSVIVMVQLNKGVLTPARIESGSFEQIKKRALEGSNYSSAGAGNPKSEEEGSFGTITTTALAIVALMFPLAPFLILGVWIWFSLKKRLPVKKLFKDAEYFREAPIAGNIEAVHALARRFRQSDDDGNLIAATFLKLINSGSLEPMTEKSVGIFGKAKESISLRLVAPPKFHGTAAKLLYELLVLASGPDGILQEKELEKYCTSNYTVMTELVEEAKQDGEKTLTQINCYNGAPTAYLSCLTERGKSLLLQIIGFKKYLLDFSLINERGIDEVVIWQDYLVFASLLGIADKAIEQFKQVYPTVMPYQERAEYFYLLAYQYQRASYHAAVSAQAARSSGSGGHSSFGGGGGFSGGGSGGGTR